MSSSVRARLTPTISVTSHQVVHVCAEHKKPDKLLKHVARVRESVPAGCRNAPRVLIFANRVKTVRFLANTLAKEGYKVVQLHGQRPQVGVLEGRSEIHGIKARSGPCHIASTLAQPQQLPSLTAKGPSLPVSMSAISRTR